MSKQLDARAAHDRLRAALQVLRDAERNALTLFAEILRQIDGLQLAPLPP